MGKRSPFCQQIHENKHTKIFKNKVAQRKTGMDLHICPSAIYYIIIKQFKESDAVSVVCQVFLCGATFIKATSNFILQKQRSIILTYQRALLMSMGSHKHIL